MGISPAVVITSKLIKGIPRIQGTIPISLAMTLILMPSGMVRLTRAAMVPIRVEMTTAIQISLTPQLNLVKCRSEEHTSELQSLMRISYAVFCLKKKKNKTEKENKNETTRTQNRNRR